MHRNEVMVVLTIGIIGYGNGYRLLVGMEVLVWLAWHGVIQVFWVVQLPSPGGFQIPSRIVFNVLKINDIPNHLLTFMVCQRNSTGKRAA